MPDQRESISRAIRLHAMLTEILKVVDDGIDTAGLRMLTGTVEQVKGWLPDAVGDHRAGEADRFFPTGEPPTVSTMRVTLAGMTGWLAGVVVNANLAEMAEASNRTAAAPETPTGEGYGMYL